MKAKEIVNLLSVFEDTPFAFVITKTDGTIICINKEFTKTTGYSELEVIGKKIGKKDNILYSGFHSSSFYKKMWDTILQGNTFNTEVMNVKKDGKKYWQNLIIKPYRDNEVEGNPIVNFIAIITDITEKRTRDLKLKSYLESSPDILIISDFDKKIIDTFPEKGVSTIPFLLDSVGKQIKDVFPANVNFLAENAFEYVLKNNGTYLYNFFINVSNEIKYYQAIVKKYNHSGFITILRDVTQLKVWEDSRNKLLDIMPDGVILISNLHIVYSNRAMNNIVGISHEKLIGENVIQYISKKDRVRFIQKIKTILSGEEQSIELYFINYEGIPILVEISGVKTIYKEKNSILLIVRNLTLKKHQSENALGITGLKELFENYRR